MALKLDDVHPFGRSFNEYGRKFALADEDLDKKIKSVADGSAAFNTEMKTLGEIVTSPLTRSMISISAWRI
ncbi:MAG: hypothetical protein ACHQ6U_03880 [Thermodesulfobacteriota bacterium]